MEKWFDGPKKLSRAERILGNLHEKTKILWYEIAEDSKEESEELFERLNIGRIPLTSAEIMKAWLMSPNFMFASDSAISKAEQESRFDETVKTWRHEMSMQWDEMEHALGKEDFWGFLCNNKTVADTRIDYILELMLDEAPTKQQTADPHFTFTKLTATIPHQNINDVQSFWRDICECYQTLRYWYDDHSNYHLIGYLIHTGKPEILRGLLHFSKENTKHELDDEVYRQVKESITSKQGDLDLEELRYTDDRDLLLRILTLFNVESIRRLAPLEDDDRPALDPLQRYPFHYHKQQNWSLEHIHPQSAKEIDNPNDRRAWLLLYENELQTKDDDGSCRALEYIKQLKAKKAMLPNVEEFEQHFNTISRVLDSAGAEEDDAIGNLALLGIKNNITLSNAFFLKKRDLILKLENDGQYIPICTRRAFLRYYRVELGSFNEPYWTAADRESYTANIRSTLAKFTDFTADKGNA